MDISGSSREGEEIKTKILRIQVRIKAILESLIINTDTEQSKGPIIKFLNRLTTAGKFIPDDYLTPLEKQRLTLDDHGRIMYFIIEKL